MSTKTSIKRIALVAVSALGFGLMSVVPARASAIAVANMAITGTASGDAEVASGTAATVINTTTGGAAHGFRLESPAGTKSYIGSGVANATVGTIALTNTDATATLTLATTFLASSTAGKWTVCVASEGTATDQDTAAELEADLTDAVIAAGTTAECENFFVYNTTATYVGGAGRTVTSASNISQDVNGQITYFIVSDSSSATYTVSAAGMTILSAFGTNAGWTSATALTASSNDVITNNNGSSAAGGVTWAPNNPGTSVLQIKTTSAEAGTGTLTVTPLNSSGTPGAARTASATWASAPVASAQFSTIYLNAGTTQADASNDDTATGVNCAKTVGTQCANIAVQIKDQLDRALDLKPLSVTITGPGTLGLDGDNSTAAALTYTTTATGRALSVTSLAGSFAAISVFPDGSAGTATITISSGTTVLGSKSVTFFGSAAKISVVSQTYKVARATAAGAKLGLETSNTSSTTGYQEAVLLLVEDADGTDVAATVTCLPADLTIIASCTIAADDNATYGAGTGYYNVAVTSAVNGVSGASTTVVFRTLVGTAYVVSEPVTFTLGGSIASTKATLDKAAYSPGEAMVMTVEAFDSAGNKAYDGQAMAYSITANKPVGGALPSAALALRDGKRSTSATAPTLFAPSTVGTFTITVTGNDADYTSVLATATVEDEISSAAANAAADAASEAIDAANAATDAANLAAEAADAATVAAEEARDAADAATAAVEALATEVATLMAALKAQITTLANTVAKIAKKVKA